MKTNHQIDELKGQKVKTLAWLIRKDLMMIILKYIKVEENKQKKHKFMTSTTLQYHNYRVQCRKGNATKNTKVVNEWDMPEISHAYPHGPILVISVGKTI